MHTCARAYKAQANLRIYQRGHTHARTLARTHARTHVRSHARARTRTHARAHTHTLTHTLMLTLTHIGTTGGSAGYPCTAPRVIVGNGDQAVQVRMHTHTHTHSLTHSLTHSHLQKTHHRRPLRLPAIYACTYPCISSVCIYAGPSTLIIHAPENASYAPPRVSLPSTSSTPTHTCAHELHTHIPTHTSVSHISRACPRALLLPQPRAQTNNAKICCEKTGTSGWKAGGRCACVCLCV